MEKKYKEFRPTSWAIDNKTSIYVLVFILAVFGFSSYVSIPKEQFPEIVIPYVMVGTIYPGASPADIENLITRPLEKNMKAIEGVKKITSNSVQDFSTIVVELNTGVEIAEAKQRVQDAVDKTKNERELPDDLDNEPSVSEIDFSEYPIMFINVSGNYDLNTIKKYAEQLQDKFESVPQVSRVEMVGALDREIQVDVDMYRMQAAAVTFSDIESAISFNNMTISGGNINMHGMSRSVRVIGEFTSVEEIGNISLVSSSGAIVKIKDIAAVTDGYKKAESFARLNGKNVITLNVVKRSGQNLINAADQIKVIINEMKAEVLPEDLSVTITGDQSYFTRTMLKEVNNTIIIGFILVTLILMFFMGLTNAIFVGLSIPLSMALAYIILPPLGNLIPGVTITMNMLVMFSFIFALGIIVDDAIVVIENTHRIFQRTRWDIAQSAKAAAGEVFVPILSGTLTTLAPFIPLAFWPGVVGKFMIYIPVTLMIALFSSLIVAYIINPVFAVSYMKHDEEIVTRHPKTVLKNGLIIAGLSAILYLPGFTISKGFIGAANLGIFIAISVVLHNLYGYKIINRFQQRTLPSIMRFYEKTLWWTLRGKRPYWALGGTIALFFFSIFFAGARDPKVLFFPDSDPSNLFVYIKMPVGTDVNVTDSVTKIVEGRVMKVLGDSNPMVESVIANVALSASEDMFEAGRVTSNRGKITISFVEFAKRHGENTTPYMDKLRSVVKDIPGVEITVDKEQNGPPVGKPVNIEISSEDYDELIATSENLIRYLDSIGIDGVEELKSDFQSKKPELIVAVDRERANREGITAGRIGAEIRTAILGNESSKFREDEDQYPIQLRYNESQRENINRLMNLKITFMDMATGLLRKIPLSSVATIQYQNAYGGINRKDLKRVITVYSNLISGYNSNEVNFVIRQELKNYNKPKGVEINITGEQEEQKENSIFLGRALMVSVFLVLFILITQFNSVSKPFIILSEVIFSFIGVLLGFSLFKLPYSIIMTGVGIIALAGIVVRNGILLVEFTDVLKKEGSTLKNAIIGAGLIRITPIVLTATATILGLVPLAIGFNINFGTLLTSLNPQIHFGGDMVSFFGPLAWAIIFGLSFATFLTLVMIPIMYYILYAAKVRIKRNRELKGMKMG